MHAPVGWLVIITIASAAFLGMENAMIYCGIKAGVTGLFAELRAAGLRIGLASASRNAGDVVRLLGIADAGAHGLFLMYPLFEHVFFVHVTFLCDWVGCCLWWAVFSAAVC